MKVLYNFKKNSFLILPSYLVVVDEGVVHISNPFAFWIARKDLILLGDL
jgi:hypothetical protein